MQIELTFDGLGVDKRVGMSVGLGVGCGRKENISDEFHVGQKHRTKVYMFSHETKLT